MTTFRWIIFLPAFAIIQLVGEVLGRSAIAWILTTTYLFSPNLNFILIKLPVILLSLYIFYYLINLSTKICPDKIKGASTCFGAYLVLNSFWIFLNFDTYTQTELVLISIFGIVCLVTLFRVAISGKSKPKERQTSDKILDLPD